jgi:nucleoside-diphosphate-sugar epimerase
VDETRRCRPQTSRARRRVDAESILRRFGVSCHADVVILRAPGIYASDRLPLERVRRKDPVLRVEDDVFTNHIHAADLAMLACKALSRGKPGRVYNASDDTELRMGEYFDFVADVFDMERPPRVSRAEAAARLSATALSFMRESRRLSNVRMKAELGMKLRYPTVLSGIMEAREELGNPSRDRAQSGFSSSSAERE